MSFWSGAIGVIVVSVPGISQEHKTFILKTVLDHLPKVTGSEGDMDVFVNLTSGHDESSPMDELGRRVLTHLQSVYTLTIDGLFRDRSFDESLRAINEWLCRLSKRLYVEYVHIDVYGDTYDCNNTHNEYTFSNDSGIYSDMHEGGSNAWIRWMYPDMRSGYPTVYMNQFRRRRK